LTLEDKERDDTLCLEQQGEEEMIVVKCPRCVIHNRNLGKDRGNYGVDERIVVTCHRGGDPNASYQAVELEGVITCKRDGHKRPIKLIDNMIDETQQDLPATESRKLTDVIQENAPGLVEDIEEAERAYFSLCFKASVVMCRRALQLALEAKTSITGQTLGPLLNAVEKMGMVDAREMQLARRVLDYGNHAAHQTGALDPEQVRVIIFDTVQVLNHVYKAKWPALKSRKGSDGP